MSTNTVLDEIQDLNLSYMLLAQRLLNDDFATALFRLKIDESLGRVLVSLSARQLARMARTNQLLFRLHLDDADQVSQLTREKREQSLGQTHASLLMAACQY